MTTDRHPEQATTNGQQQATEEAPEPEPKEAVPADGRWGVISLMGHKTIAGRVVPDPLLGGGTMLVQTPALDGVTLRQQQTFQPSSGALYLATWGSREEVLDILYPPVRSAYELTRPDDEDDEDDDGFGVQTEPLFGTPL
jgi:hypothetical protein